MPALNPYIDPGPFGRCTIGGVELAGVIVSIDGAEKPEDWTFQKGTSGNNAVSIWNGTKLAEQIVLRIRLHNSGQYAQHEIVRRTLRPKIGNQPPPLAITNGVINGEGIVTVACRLAPPPKWFAVSNYWEATVTLCEFNPSKPANAGRVRASAGSNGGPAGPTAAEKEFEQLTKEAAAL